MVVLLQQVARILRHFLLHSEKEGQSAEFPPRLSPFDNVLAVVDRYQVGTEWIE